MSFPAFGRHSSADHRRKETSLKPRWLHVGLWLTLASLGYLTATKARSSMKELLSADLVPQILADSPSILLVRVQTAHLTDHGGETPAMDTGIVTFQIVEVFRSSTLAPNGVIEVPAHRISDPIKRAKYNNDQWNNLELTPGELLLLACQPLIPPTTWKALAATQVESVTSPDVAAMRRCIAIQKFSGPPEGRAGLVGTALKSKDELLRNYAVALAGDGKTFPRETAAG